MVRVYAKWGVRVVAVGRGERHSGEKKKKPICSFSVPHLGVTLFWQVRGSIFLCTEGETFVWPESLFVTCVKRKVGQRKKQYPPSTVTLVPQNWEDSNTSLSKARKIRRLPESHSLIYWICGKLSGNLIHLPAHFLAIMQRKSNYIISQPVEQANTMVNVTVSTDLFNGWMIFSLLHLICKGLQANENNSNQTMK